MTEQLLKGSGLIGTSVLPGLWGSECWGRQFPQQGLFLLAACRKETHKTLTGARSELEKSLGSSNLHSTLFACLFFCPSGCTAPYSSQCSNYKYEGGQCPLPQPLRDWGKLCLPSVGKEPQPSVPAPGVAAILGCDPMVPVPPLQLSPLSSRHLQLIHQF